MKRAYPTLTDTEYMARIIQAAGRELLQLRLTDPKQATTERLSALVQNVREWLGRGR